MNHIDRRTFLTAAAAALAVPVSSQAASTPTPLIINALGALEDPNSTQTIPTAKNPIGATQPTTMSARALRDAHASGLTAVNLTLGFVAGNQEPFDYSVREVAQMDALIRRQSSDLLKVFSTQDILTAKRQGKIGIIYGFQNAAMVGQDATRIALFADQGVRVIQLTYNPANQIGDGSVAPQNRGLSAFGHEVVAALNASRVMVDLSHSGQTTCLDAARASTAPISINHTGCRALNDLPRNKTDEELRLVASKGGFVGIYFMPFLNATGHATAEDVVAHIDHAVQVCGEDHVGIGTDGSVTAIDDLEKYKAVLAREIEARRAAGVGAAGERPDTLPFVINLRGVDQFRDLAGRLSRRGYSSARVDKILGGNFLRYARDIWGT